MPQQLPADLQAVFANLQAKKEKFDPVEFKNHFACVLGGGQWVDGTCRPRLTNTAQGNKQLELPARMFTLADGEGMIDYILNKAENVGKAKFVWPRLTMTFTEVEKGLKTKMYFGVHNPAVGSLMMWDQNGKPTDATEQLVWYREESWGLFSPIVLDHYTFNQLRGIHESNMRGMHVFCGMEEVLPPKDDGTVNKKARVWLLAVKWEG